jgi:FkbM family methyltransferase
MSIRKRLESWIAVASAAREPRQRAWNLLSLGLLGVQRRLAPGVELRYPLYTEVDGKELRLHVSGPSDVSVFWEVFSQKEYERVGTLAPRTILDVGGNVGFTAIYFATRFPAAVIHTLEPDPRNFERLRRNVAGYANIRLHQVALAASDGTLELYANSKWGMSSSLLPREGGRSVRVAALTLDSFLEREGIREVDLLKFDIEGAEYDVFRSCRKLSSIAALIGEFHEDLVAVDWTRFAELFADYELSTHRISPKRLLVLAHRTGSGPPPSGDPSSPPRTP